MALRVSLLVSALLLVLPAWADLPLSGTGITGRYWDCCKPSCGWKSKAKFNQPVLSCDAKGNPLTDFDTGTGCEQGGTAYNCPNQSPWAVNDTYAYGFVGAFIVGGLEDAWCCGCYELTFQDDRLKGKTIVVQASNTDYDTPGDNMFTFAVPGGNNSFSQCARQWSISPDAYGSNSTGVGARSDCDALPEAQRSGCYWRFDWLLNIDRPRVNWKRVACPAAITNITGCIRDDEKTIFGQGTKKNGAAGPATGSIASLMTVSALTLILSTLLS